MPIPHYRYSFEKGFENLTNQDSKKLRSEIYRDIGCTSYTEFWRRRKAWRDIPAHAYKLITEKFAKYGVPENKVWTRKKI